MEGFSVSPTWLSRLKTIMLRVKRPKGSGHIQPVQTASPHRFDSSTPPRENISPTSNYQTWQLSYVKLSWSQTNWEVLLPSLYVLDAAMWLRVLLLGPWLAAAGGWDNWQSMERRGGVGGFGGWHLCFGYLVGLVWLWFLMLDLHCFAWIQRTSESNLASLFFWM